VTRFEPVAYEPSQRDEVRGLMAEVWGEAATPSDFDWWYERNPTGPRLLSLVVDGGRVAGASGMSFFALRLGGEERKVAFALDAAMHADYRGQGLWSLLELHNEAEAARAGAAAVLGFPNDVSDSILVGKLGWRELSRLRLWARPLSLRARESGLRDVPGETLDRFGDEAEQVYRTASADWGNHLLRPATYLNWRFVESPRPYRILAERRAGVLEGWAVVTHRRFRGHAVGVVADLIAVTGRAARALLRRAARAVRGRALVALVSPRERARYLAAGFVPTHMALRLIGKPFAPGVELAAERAAWHLTLGDTDLF
jgi:GNAT superfamily N-acetyltransferase